MSSGANLLQFLKDYSAGVVAAGLSVAFAGYMLFTGGAGGGLRVEQVVAVRHAPVSSPLLARPEHVIAPAHGLPGQPLPMIGGDIITGSIEPVKTRARQDDEKPAHGRPGSGKAPRYVLRFAAPRMALVEGAGRLWRVGRGDILPGAGRVVDIRQQARHRWVVRTFDGRRYREIGER